MKRCDPIWWTDTTGQQHQAEIMRTDQLMIAIRVWLRDGSMITKRVEADEIIQRQPGRPYP